MRKKDGLWERTGKSKGREKGLTKGMAKWDVQGQECLYSFNPRKAIWPLVKGSQTLFLDFVDFEYLREFIHQIYIDREYLTTGK